MDTKEMHIKEFEYEILESDSTAKLVPYPSSISIQIAEPLIFLKLCDADYGYYIWPSSKIMADFISNNRESIFNSADSNLLELGSGTSLPSIVARKCANLNEIIMTDLFENTPKLFELAKYTLGLNEIEYYQASHSLEQLSFGNNRNRIRIQHLNWIEFKYELLESLPKIDFIIGSDVFFDGKSLILNVAYLIEANNPDLVFYTTYHLRSSSKFIKLTYLLEKHGLTIEQLGTGMESLSCTQEIYLLKITKGNSGQNLND